MSQPYGVVGQRINLTCSMTKASNLTDMIEFRRNPSPGEPTVRVYQDKSKCFPHNKKPLPPRYKVLTTCNRSYALDIDYYLKAYCHRFTCL